jgi:hypothetical protein
VCQPGKSDDGTVISSTSIALRATFWRAQSGVRIAPLAGDASVRFTQGQRLAPWGTASNDCRTFGAESEALKATSTPAGTGRRQTTERPVESIDIPSRRLGGRTSCQRRVKHHSLPGLDVSVHEAVASEQIANTIVAGAGGNGTSSRRRRRSLSQREVTTETSARGGHVLIQRLPPDGANNLTTPAGESVRLSAYFQMPLLGSSENAGPAW